LRPGARMPALQAQLGALAANLRRSYPDVYDDDGWRFDAVPLHGSLVAEVRRPLMVLFGAVGLLLLVVCANVGGLLLARSASRKREIVTRFALGAGRGRLLRQLT